MRRVPSGVALSGEAPSRFAHSGSALAGVALALAALLLAGCGSTDLGTDRVDLSEGWQYRWGDSPLGADGVPVWVGEAADHPAWHDTALPVGLPGRNGDKYLWLRVPLPGGEWVDPAVYLTSVLNPFEAFVAGRRVYGFGDMSEWVGHGYGAAQWHLFGYEGAEGGGFLTLRLLVSTDESGVPLVADNRALAGSEWSLLRYMLVISIDRFVLGCLFLLLSFMALDLYHHRRERAEHYYLAFAGFSFCTGLAFSLTAEVAQLLIPSPVARFGVAQFGIYFFPVGLFAFCELIAGAGEKRPFRWLWRVFATVGVVLLALQFLGFPFYVHLFFAWTLVLVVSVLVGIGLSVRAATHGNVEARIFYLGLIAALLFILHDVAFALGWIPFWRWLSPWGVFLFIAALLHIVERRRAADQRQLAVYSEELKTYSQELESRVEERTRDLSDKNEALERALAELHEAQSQLVMREKMASLGNLVAGVAHEINNPVGAIRASADVTRRAVAKLQDQLAGDDDARRALKALDQNSRVVEEASERVARIVRSLKAFAELDEAEYQEEVDVREGLQNTLTLVESRLPAGVTVVREFEPVPSIPCWPGELNQVFMNVLVNAIEAMERAGLADESGGGRIAVRAAASDEVVRVEVVDQGKGIAAEHLGRVFDPGYTTKGTGVGTGLGLSTSYRTVQKHGGRIMVESEVGEGTTVTIELPRSGNEHA